MATIANVTDLRPQATRRLTPLARFCASVLAASAHRSSVGAEGIRDLFAVCEQQGYGFPSGCEAAVMSELAAMANGTA